MKANENLAKVTLLENVSIFQQKFDPERKIWEDQGSSFKSIIDVMTLLANENEPMLLVGGLESNFLLKAFESRWKAQQQSAKKDSDGVDDEEEVGEGAVVVSVTPGSQMTKEACLNRVLEMMEPKGEHNLRPKDGAKMLWVVDGLDTRSVALEDCLLTMLSDVAKNMTIFNRAAGFRRKHFTNIQLLGQIDLASGMGVLRDFKGINNFIVVASKDTSASAVIAAQNWRGRQLTESLVEKTLAIYGEMCKTYDFNSTEADNPVNLLSLTDLSVYIDCLEFGDDLELDENGLVERWRKSLFDNIVLPLWTVKERNKIKAILKEQEVSFDDKEEEYLACADEDNSPAFERVLADLNSALSEDVKLVVLIGMSGTGKHSVIRQCCLENTVLMLPRAINLDKVDYDKVAATDNPQNLRLGCIINGLVFTTIPEGSSKLDRLIHELHYARKRLPDMHFFLPLAVTDYSSTLLQRLLFSLKKEGGLVIGVPEWTEDDMKYCCKPGDEDLHELDPACLLKIHMGIDNFAKSTGSHFCPTPAMLELAYRQVFHEFLPFEHI